MIVALVILLAAESASAPPHAGNHSWGAPLSLGKRRSPTLAAGSPLQTVCEALRQKARAEWEGSIDDGPYCSLASTHAGAGPLLNAAVIRLHEGDPSLAEVGLTDVWGLALETQQGWTLGGILVDGSYGGAGAWTQRAQVDSVAIDLTPQGAVVVVTAREAYENSDCDDHEDQLSTWLSVCVVASSVDCGRVLTQERWATSMLSVDSPWIPNEADYGRVGVHDWRRPVRWNGSRFTVEKENGARHPRLAVPALPAMATAEALLDAIHKNEPAPPPALPVGPRTLAAARGFAARVRAVCRELGIVVSSQSLDALAKRISSIEAEGSLRETLVGDAASCPVELTASEEDGRLWLRASIPDTNDSPIALFWHGPPGKAARFRGRFETSASSLCGEDFPSAERRVLDMSWREYVRRSERIRDLICGR